MDKEQIIIDGVDVSECLFYQSNFEEDYDVKIKHFCSNWHNSCESVNNSNCYFKQLARKTQELETICKAFDIEYAYDDDGKIFGRSNKLRSLEQECEELKSQIDADYEDYSQELETLRNIIENKEKRNARLFVISNNYRKALEEIEKIIASTDAGTRPKLYDFENDTKS